jgi:hypothetical protein
LDLISRLVAMLTIGSGLCIFLSRRKVPRVGGDDVLRGRKEVLRVKREVLWVSGEVLPAREEEALLVITEDLSKQEESRKVSIQFYISSECRSDPICSSVALMTCTSTTN